jgi:hypothetical protein
LLRAPLKVRDPVSIQLGKTEDKRQIDTALTKQTSQNGLAHGSDGVFMPYHAIIFNQMS